MTVFIKTNGCTDVLLSVISSWSFLDLLFNRSWVRGSNQTDGVHTSGLYTFPCSHFITCGCAEETVFAMSSNWLYNTVMLSFGCSLVLFVGHRFQNDFIGDCDKKGPKSSPGFQRNCGRRGEAHMNLWYICHY